MTLTEVIKQHALRPNDKKEPLFHDQILSNVPDSARVVVLGSNTYGTDKFIREKALITERLIQQRGFDGVLMDVDFTSLIRPHLFLWGLGTGDLDAQQALKDVDHWPQWLLRNQSIVNFLTWLREHNVDLRNKQDARKLGVVLFGLDACCLDYAVSAIAEATTLPKAARARGIARYLHIKQGTGQGHLAHQADLPLGGESGDERQLTDADMRELAKVVAQRVQTKLQLLQGAAEDSFTASLFSEEAAYEVFKMLFLQEDVAWGTWATSLASSVTKIDKHLSEVHSRPAKVVLWCHSSLARPSRGWAGGSLTDMLRDRYGAEAVYTIDMTTSHGRVAASTAYNGQVSYQQLPPAPEGTLEQSLHEAAGEECNTLALDLGHAKQQLEGALLQGSTKMRSLGLTYSAATPAEEQTCDVQLKGIDMLLFFKHTNAIMPLDVSHGEWLGDQAGLVSPPPVQKLDAMQEDLRDAAKLFGVAKEH